jgi:hypothetical protein
MVLAVCIFMPGIVLAAHFRFAGNNVTPFLLPRFLSNCEYPKSIIRQAGTGWFLFCVWLLTIAMAVSYAIPRELTHDSFWFLGIFAFAVPIIAVMSLFIAIYYLSIGVFARSKNVKPSFQSIYATETNRLDLYMKRLRRYLKINIVTFVLLIGIIGTEAAMGVEPDGIVVLINVALLITFIMTTWRVRNYLLKATIAMEQSREDTFTKTLGNPFAMSFMWYYSFALIKKYDSFRRLPQSTPQSRSNVTSYNR